MHKIKTDIDQFNMLWLLYHLKKKMSHLFVRMIAFTSARKQENIEKGLQVLKQFVLHPSKKDVTLALS